MENKMRLNKYLSDAGVCSRRRADVLVEQGLVEIDGRVALLGEKITGNERILVEGKEVHPVEKKVILAYHKPKGIVCSTVDQGENRNNIVDAVDYPIRVYPVGRLDKDSEGLIFLTNDGNIVNRIMKAKNKHEKEYNVSVDQPVTQEFLHKMGNGVKIEEGVTRPCKIWKTGERTFTLILTQGWNRQIRKMCAALGYEVTKLVRVRIMNISLDRLRAGTYRELTEAEVQKLYELSENSEN